MRRTALAALAAVAAVIAAFLTASPASAAGLTASFQKVSDWGSGFEGKVTVTNGTGSAASWSVDLDLPSGYTITTSWDANRSGSGQHFTFTAPGWAGQLAPGGTFSFGFNGSPGNFGSLAGCHVNGANCDGSGGGTAPSAPGGLTGTSTSNSVSLTWSAAGGATGYNVFRNGTKVGSPSGTSYTDTGLSASTNYSYQVSATNSAGESAKSGTFQIATKQGGGTTPAGLRAAPYLWLGWGDPPSATSIMSTTGIKNFTMAFILSPGGCAAAWDGQRPLTGGVDQQTISAIRAAGGDVVPSIGGWQGNKLGPNCSTPEALAGAYQSVINAYGLHAIDVDIENTDEFENEAVQDRILTALKIVKQNNPGIQTILTFGTSTTGPNYYGNRLIERSQALGANIDVFTLMPFDFGSSNIYNDTVNASAGLNAKLRSVFGWTEAQAYAHQGISGMNGLSDNQELTTTATWTQIRDWAKSHGLARLAFWGVNRDRGCPGGGVTSNCSGISQPDWEFTRITAGF